MDCSLFCTTQCSIEPDTSMLRNHLKHKLRNALMASLLLFGISFVQAETVDELLVELTSASLRETRDVLERLSLTEDPILLPLFQNLVEGDLYFVESTLELVTVQRVNGVYEVRALNSGELLDIDRDVTEKLRVNNALRIYLRSAIAKIQLTSSDAELRLAAVKELFKSVDDDTIATVIELRETENNTRIQDAMDIVIAIDATENASTSAEKIAAVEWLGTSLEPAVRNQLVSLARQTDDGGLAEAAEIALRGIEQKANFYSKVDTLFFGLSLGSVLLLASIGLAITFGVMGVINMAHGEMIMLGAYTTYVVQLIMPNHIDMSIWVAIPAAFMVSGMMGVLIERSVIQFLHGRPLETLLATFGISLILQQLVRSIFSPLNRQVSTPSWMSGSIELNPILFVTLNRFYIFIFALIVFALLLIVLNKTSLGLNVRAVSQNRNMAKAMGIKTARVDAMTFGLGSGIAGIAGVALSQLTNVGPNLGQAYIIDSFMVVVFGGVGNLFGTLVAAFTLGIANKVFEPVTGAVLASILVLVFIILFIQKRPKGLFPQKGRAAE